MIELECASEVHPYCCVGFPLLLGSWSSECLLEQWRMGKIQAMSEATLGHPPALEANPGNGVSQPQKG